MIAVCAKSQGLDALVEERFGRAQYFVLFNEDNSEVAFIDNAAKHESGGAGGMAVRLLHDAQVDVVLVPELGPKAMDAIKAFEIKVYRYVDKKTVKETIEDYQNGLLKRLDDSTATSKSGLRRV